jgi:hypothetical protein
MIPNFPVTGKWTAIWNIQKTRAQCFFIRQCSLYCALVTRNMPPNYVSYIHFIHKNERTTQTNSSTSPKINANFDLACETIQSLSISLPQSIYPSVFIFVAPTWITGHPWNSSFHFSFLILGQSAGLLGRGISPTQSHYLHRTTQTQSRRRQTSMPWVEFEPTIPVFERAKTFHALVRAATVIGHCLTQFEVTGRAYERMMVVVQKQTFSWLAYMRWEHSSLLCSLVSLITY